MGLVAIPQNMLGTMLNEFTIQRALIKLNPKFNFDWGGRLGIFNPKQTRIQGIWFGPKHVCSMDRGNIPQAPIWSTKREMVRIRYEDATAGERLDPIYSEEVEYGLDGLERPTGWVYVLREMKDDLLFIGWQAVLRKIVSKNFPGVTAEALSRELRVTVDPLKEVGAAEVAENRTHLYDVAGREIVLGA